MFNLSDIPQNLYKPIVISKPSLSGRLFSRLVDWALIGSLAYALLNFPYGAVIEWLHGDDYLLQGTGVVSREFVTTVADRGFGGDCDTRNMGKRDYIKRCTPRQNRYSD
jgi:hypothetical protein